jgi:hypothetical protein
VKIDYPPPYARSHPAVWPRAQLLRPAAREGAHT